MKIAITGFANSGKTTVFNALTGQRAATATYQSAAAEPNFGTVKVPDARVDRLAVMYKPKKITYATVEYVDYLGLTRGDPAHNRKVFDHMHDADALLHVVRAFEDEAVPHPMGGVDPLRDITAFEAELILGDLELVETRLQRIEKAEKKGQKQDEAEKRLLMKLMESLEAERPLRNMEFSDVEADAMRHLRFLSNKPLLAVLNIGEDALGTAEAAALEASAAAALPGERARVTALCGKIEMEISELEPEEARSFLDDLGIKEPALTRLISESYSLLGLISFLTVGPDEVRAWTIRKATQAMKAAGKIHSDIERGFIRAEVVSYDDLITSEGMAGARDKGLLRLEGKTYTVRDGDIINFRFNV